VANQELVAVWLSGWPDAYLTRYRSKPGPIALALAQHRTFLRRTLEPDERHGLALAAIATKEQLGEVAGRSALVDPELPTARHPIAVDQSRPVDVAHVTVGAGLYEAQGNDGPVLAFSLAGRIIAGIASLDERLAVN